MTDRTVRIRLEAAVQGFNAALATSKASVRGLSREVGQASRKNKEEMQAIGVVAAAAGATMAAGFVAAGKAAINFESSFAGVRKTVDASEAEFAQMAAGFRGMAREIPTSVHGLNAIGEAAGQLGIEKSNILGFTRTMADLGVATNLAGDEAATAFARFANITQMAQTDFDRLGSTVVALGNNLATTESEIAAFGLRLAGAGAQVGLTEAEILGLGGALSSVGINAEAGGTAISKVMIDLAKAVSEGGDQLQMFAGVSQMSAEQFATSFREDPASAIVAFIEGLGQVEAKGGDLFATLEELGITEQRMRDAMLRTAGAGTLVADAMGLANRAFEENTALTDEAAQRYGTVESRIQLAKNAIVDAGISIGQTFTPAIGGAADAVADFAGGVADMPGVAQAALVGIGGLGGAASLAAGGFLLAAPRIVATKDALSTLATTAPRATAALRGVGTVLTGPWGLAIAGAVSAVGLYAKAKADARLRVEEFKATLDEETGAFTENTTAHAVNRLEQEGAIAAARDLGINIKTLTDAALGDERAMRNIAAATQDAVAAQYAMYEGAGEVSDEIDEQANSAALLDRVLGRLNPELAKAQDEFRETAVATAEAQGTFYDLQHAIDSGLDPSMAHLAISSQNAAAAQSQAEGGSEDLIKSFDDQTMSVEDLENALAAYADSLDRTLGSYFSIDEANDRLTGQYHALEEQVKRATEAKDADARSLEGNSAAAVANRDALREIVQATADTVQAMAEQSASSDEIQAKLDEERERLLGVVEAMGLNREEAALYIEALEAIPTDVGTDVHLDTSLAFGAIDAIIGRLRQAGFSQSESAWSARLTAQGHAAGAFRNHAGGWAGTGPMHQGPLRNDEVPAVLQTGEYVLSRQMVDAVRAFPRFHSGGEVGGPSSSIGAIVGSAMGETGAGYQSAIREAKDLVDAWHRAIEAEKQATTRRGLVADITKAERDVRTAKKGPDRARATERLADALQRVEDHDRDVARAAEEAAIASHMALLEERARRAEERDQERARRVANRDDYRFGRMSTEQQIADLSRRIGAAAIFTDEWKRLTEQRMGLIQEEARTARRAADDAVDEAFRMLDERQRILDSMSDAEDRYADAVQEAQRRASEAVRTAVAARRREIESDLMPSLSGGVWSARSIGARIDRNVADEDEYRTQLGELRSAGLSDEAVSMLGLDSGRQMLGQVRRLLRDGADEIAQLNASVAAAQGRAEQLVATERMDRRSQLAQDIASVERDLNAEMQQLGREHNDEMRALGDELAEVGRDNGRTWAEAHAEGIASGIPAIEEQVQRVMDLLNAADAAERRVADAGIAAQVAGMRASFGLAPDSASDELWDGWIADGSRSLSDAERRLREKAGGDYLLATQPMGGATVVHETTNININGTVVDPEGAARAVQQVLRDSGKRTGVQRSTRT